MKILPLLPAAAVALLLPLPLLTQTRPLPLAAERLSALSTPDIASAIHLLAADLSRPQFLDPQPGRLNYLLGADPSRWRTNVARYGRVRYRNIYPGIDLVYYRTRNQLEYDLVVSPHASIAPIRLQFDRSSRLSLSPAGDLTVATDSASMTMRRPRIYQEIGGRHVEIAGGYSLHAANRVSFRLGAYDRSRALVIDPIVVFSSLLGGNADDVAYSVASDPAGNTYIAGYTNSASFPATAGAYRATGSGSSDAFVAKFSPTGALLYATYLGGSSEDVAYGIAVDSSGNAYVTGSTSSTNFPSTTGAYASSYRGGLSDIFVAKLNPAGNGLVYSTYLGGAGADVGYSIALNSLNQATVAGSTASGDFPATPGAYKITFGGGTDDAFVARLDNAGASLVYASYLGGSGEDVAYGVAVDNLGNAYLAGYTQSTNFPATVGAAQTTFGGATDAFVTAFNPSATAVVYSTFLGGAQEDYGIGIAVDSSSAAYVAGFSASAAYPHTSGVFQSAKSGGMDAVLTKLSSTGALAFSTFLGGSGDDYGLAVAIDTSGNAYLTGDTSSTDFPKSPNALQSSTAGDYSAFVAEINASGAALPYASYLGGAGYETGYGITLDTAGATVVAGYTTSTDFPLTAAAQSTLSGPDDIFVARFAINPPLKAAALAIAKSHSGNFAQSQTNAAYTVAVSNDAAAGPTSGVVTVTESVPPGLTLRSMSGTGWTCSANTCTRSDALAAGGSYPSISVLVDVSSTAPAQVTNQVSVSGGGSPAANASDTTNIAPLTSITVTTSPSGLSITVDGVTATAPQTFQWVAGASHTLAVTSPQAGAGLRRVFTSWSDSGAQSHTITVPAVTTTYTASFGTQYLLTTAASPVAGGSISASPDGSYFDAGTSVQLTALPATGYAFSGYTGDLAGGLNPQTVVMSAPRSVTATFTSVGTAPTIVSVAPNGGTGAVQTFSATYTAANGYHDLQWVQMLFAVATDGGGQSFCFVHYDVQGNGFWLYSDVQGFFKGPIAPGSSSNLLQGSLCALNTSGSSVTGNGTSLTINASLVFKGAGVRNVYMRAMNLAQSDTGWIQRGTWTMAAASPGTPSVSPSTGSGTTQTFTLTYPDPPGFAGAAFGWVQFLAGAASDGGGQPFCFLHYDRAGNGLWMYSSDVGFFLGPVAPGTASNTLSSSACSINTAAASVANTSGNLVVTVPITFKAPMSGAKKLFQRTLDVLTRDTGWQQTGTWTVQ